jgi:hypothetical protein
LNSYLYKKCFVFYIISYVFSSTKLENKRAEQVLPGSSGSGSICKNDKIKFKKEIT